METTFNEHYAEFISEDYQGKFSLQIQNDLSQIRFYTCNGEDGSAFDCDKGELIAIRDMINQIIFLNSKCDCEIPKPIDAYHPIDKHICKDCNSKIIQ